MRSLVLSGLILAMLVSIGLLSGCAAGQTQLVNLDFPALGDGTQPAFIPVGNGGSLRDHQRLNVGQQASIIHVDSQGHAIISPVDFLKGHSLLGWDVTTLDQVVTCEKSPDHENLLDLKYYKNQALAQTFQLPTTSYKGEISLPKWMLLLPDKNCFLLDVPERVGVLKFDLKTGVRKELKIDESVVPGFVLNSFMEPLWDAQAQKLIVEVDQDGGGQPYHHFLARLDPDTLSLTDKVDLAVNTFISNLLYYNEASDSVIFRGQCGAFVIHGGVEGIYELSLRTGGLKLLFTEKPAFDSPASMAIALFREETGGKAEMPALPMGDVKSIAIINYRYVVMMRSFEEGMGDLEKDPHAYLIDLKTNDWQLLTGITYITWPISQEGLNVVGASSSK